MPATADFEWSAPDSLGEALQLLAGDGAIALGGGVATALLLKQGLLTPSRVVSLRRVPGLADIEAGSDGAMVLGAGCTLAQVASAPGVRAAHPALAACAAGIGNVRVRHVATLGGCLGHADPAQDLPPLLAALGARLRLASAAGERRIDVAGFFTGYMETALRPGELIVAVELAAPAAGARACYLKYTPRSEDDYATVGVACRALRDAEGRCAEVRLALAGVGPTPIVAKAAGPILEGRAPSPAALAEAAAAVAAETEPWDDLRGSAAYKRAMAAVFVHRALAEILA